MAEDKQYRVAIIGCGNMGTAILSGILTATKSSPDSSPISSFKACVRSQPSADRLSQKLSPHKSRVEVLSNQNVPSASEADIILLGHKPYMLNSVLGAEGMGDALKGKLVISVLAGISSEQILSYAQCHLIRVIPNMAAQVGESISIIEEPRSEIPEHMVKVTEWMFEQIGRVQILPSPLMPVATILVASPALLSVAVDGLLDGAVAEGVPRPSALKIVSQSLRGLAKLLDGQEEEGGAQGVHPAVLRESTSSPRGCTIQGLLTLERQGARAAFADSVIKGAEHTKNMGKMQD